MEIVKEIQGLLTSLKSLRTRFNQNTNNIDWFTNSKLKEELQLIYIKKRGINSALLTYVTLNSMYNLNRTDNSENNDMIMKMMDNLESDWKKTINLVKPMDPFANPTAALKAIERDKEKNYCWLRQILSNLPNGKHWMNFLSYLSDEEQLAALSYYQASLQEVEERAKNIATLNRLLRRLRAFATAKNSSQKSTKLLIKVKRLAKSLTVCERVCYEVWLRLLELIMCLEKRVPSQNHTSHLPIFTNLRDWRRAFSDEDEDDGVNLVEEETIALSDLKVPEQIIKNQDCLSLNDRLCFSRSKKLRRIRKGRSGMQLSCTNSRNGHEMNRNNPSNGEKAKKLRWSTDCDLTDSLESSIPRNSLEMAESNLSNSQSGSPGDAQLLTRVVDNRAELNAMQSASGKESSILMENMKSDVIFDNSASGFSPPRSDHMGVEDKVVCDGLPQLFVEKTGVPSHIELCTSILKESHCPIFSQVLLEQRGNHSKSSPSRMLPTSTFETDSQLPQRETINQSSNYLRVTSYLEAAERAEALVQQRDQHHTLIPLSYSTVDCSLEKRRKTSSAAVSITHRRAISADAIHQGDSRIQNLAKFAMTARSNDTSQPFDNSEIISFWDDYQMPFFSNSEALGPLEPYAKLPDHLLWDELYPDETEAFDLEETCDLQSPSTATALNTHLLDEWSFDDLSGPASSISLSSASISSSGFSKDFRFLPVNIKSRTSHLEEEETCSAKVDKAQQTSDVGLLSDVLGQNTSVDQNNTTSPSLDVITTHTSGYESGPDLGDTFYRHHSLTYSDGPLSEWKNNSLTRETAVQTCFEGHLLLSGNHKRSGKAPAVILEEVDGGMTQPKSSSSEIDTDSNLLVQSEQNLTKLRDFLNCILGEDPVVGCQFNSQISCAYASNFSQSPIQFLNKSTQSSHDLTSAGLVRNFQCITKSTEKNLQLLEQMTANRVSGINETPLVDANNSVLTLKWRDFSKWIRKHSEDLERLTELQTRIHDISPKLQLLTSIANQMTERENWLNNSPKADTLSTLGAESFVLCEEAEKIRDILITKRLREIETISTSTNSSPELSDLERQFDERFHGLLDRTIYQSNILVDMACTTKAKLIYLEAMVTRFQSYVPKKKCLANIDEGKDSPIYSSYQKSESLSSDMLLDANVPVSTLSNADSTSKESKKEKNNRRSVLKRVLLSIILPMGLVALVAYFLYPQNHSHNCQVTDWPIVCISRSRCPPL